MSTIFKESFFISLFNFLVSLFIDDTYEDNSSQNEETDIEKFNSFERLLNWGHRKH